VSARAGTLARPPRRVVGDAVAAGTVVASAAFLLVARASLVRRPETLPLFVAMYLAILVAGVTVPVPSARVRAGRRTRVVVLLVGIAAIGIASILTGPAIAAPLPWSAATNTVAAVGEEAVFRRVLFGWLERFGPGVAVGVTAAVFALVHVPLYGPRALPVDLGAGLLLSWQRASTGSWRESAVTHVVANLVAVAR
jgi:membrane protease YdiL (CAAX protease family)